MSLNPWKQGKKINLNTNIDQNNKKHKNIQRSYF